MYGFVKAAYGVGEALELLSIGRTSLYGAVRRGELTPAKFGKRTLFYAIDLAEGTSCVGDYPTRSPIRRAEWS
jgi:hypothetical protein